MPVAYHAQRQFDDQALDFYQAYGGRLRAGRVERERQLSEIELYGGPLDGALMRIEDPVPEHLSLDSRRDSVDYRRITSGEYVFPWFVYDRLAGYQRWLHS